MWWRRGRSGEGDTTVQGGSCKPCLNLRSRWDAASPSRCCLQLRLCGEKEADPPVTVEIGIGGLPKGDLRSLAASPLTLEVSAGTTDGERVASVHGRGRGCLGGSLRKMS